MTRSTTPMRERDRDRERDKERGKKRDKKEDIGPPGAGTLWVYDVDLEDRPSRRPLSRGKAISKDRTSRRDVNTWEGYCQISHDPVRSLSPDSLLERGIEGYRFIPASQGGVLGRGKFSTVYRVLDVEGKELALKHTPLHPHHPLIAARLLREPTLLAQLPAHPCLIGVHGSIQTPGHFYLLETYASSHTPLSAHPTPILPSRAAYLLDQLVSVTRDCLHAGGRVVHRDLKGENVLVDLETGDLLVLDLGLATHYSASEPKLTTCCGSPAFHSPEIVNALNYAPGVVTYYGPELDIWCIALTLLSLLLNIRYPLGPSHKSLHVMRERTLDRLQELDELYPPSSPFRNHPSLYSLSEAEREFEVAEWKRVRLGLWKFLVIDGNERMAGFAAYELGPKISERVATHAQRDKAGGFKTLSFVATDIKHTLPIYLDTEQNDGVIVLHNPTGLSERRIISYIKYILRSKGVLYHCIAVPPWAGHTGVPTDRGQRSTNEVGGEGGEDDCVVAQLVLSCPSPTAEFLANIPKRDEKKEISWVSSLIASAAPSKRASSVPPLSSRTSSPHADKGGKNGKQPMGYFLKCWARIDIEHMPQLSITTTSAAAAVPGRPAFSRSSSRRSSAEHSNMSQGSAPTISTAPTSPIVSPTRVSPSQTPALSPVTGLIPLPLSPLTTLQEGIPIRPSSAPRAQSVDGLGKALYALQRNSSRNISASRIPSTRRPHPLSRQVSYERTAGRGSAPSKISITLSDPRGYAALRNILNVKHETTSPGSSHVYGAMSGPTSAGLAGPGGTTTAATSSATINTNHPPGDEIVPTVPEPIPGRRGGGRQRGGAAGGGEDNEEEERGRPRSKEDSKVLILERPQKPTSRLSPRAHSRGRKKGFLENWFGVGGRVEDGMRSVSSPPVRTRFEIGPQT